MKRQNNLAIFGSVLGLAAIGIAIDHTRHPLPEPVAAKQQDGSSDAGPAVDAGAEIAESPCAMDESPCGLSANPCGLSANPCSLE